MYALQWSAFQTRPSKLSSTHGIWARCSLYKDLYKARSLFLKGLIINPTKFRLRPAHSTGQCFLTIFLLLSRSDFISSLLFYKRSYFPWQKLVLFCVHNNVSLTTWTMIPAFKSLFEGLQSLASRYCDKSWQFSPTKDYNPSELNCCFVTVHPAEFSAKTKLQA